MSHLAQASERAPALWQPCLDTLPAVFAASRFVSRTCAQFPQLLADLVESGDLTRAYAPGELQAKITAIAVAQDEAVLKRTLRAIRRREMVRIAWRDLAGWAPLAEVLATLSGLADGCTEWALTQLHVAAAGQHGEPIGEQSGQAVRLVVLGMGKLGGGELNFSSDIDLIFAYAEDGETASENERNRLTNHEFFLRLGRKLISVLSEATADGFVFRVDMRLRPNGSTGPLVLSFDAMEHYYQAHGREWERYAWIKARAIAGDTAAGAELLARLRPFIYRKYLDYGAVAAIRELKETINSELARKNVRNNIKIGPGGIREIEFIAQVFQLIRGGRNPALQQPAVQTVLPLLASTGNLTPHAVDELLAGYAFLRKAENRLQMADDRQTHLLPTDACDRARIAFAMGFIDWTGFDSALQRWLIKIHGHFEQVFSAPQGESATSDVDLTGVWLNTADEQASRSTLRTHRFEDTDAALALLRGLRGGSAYHAFSGHGRERADRLMPLLLAAAGLTAEPLLTLQRLIKVLEAIGRRSAYFALLIENPTALSQLVKLCAASAWISDWLARHPVLLDELLNPAVLYAPVQPERLREELRQRLDQLSADDLEAQMEALREFRHSHVLRVAAAEIGPGLPAEKARVHLCHIADAVLEQSLALARAGLGKKHGEPSPDAQGERPGFAVVGYGKLGSWELGYASDLDITFLHNAPEGGMTDGAKGVPDEVFFARLGQRLIHLLATRTAAGFLYHVDMRLRPSGQAGPLVTTLAAFRKYQRTEAWAWEHQALVRARPVAGDAAVCSEFTAIRHEILTLPRDAEKLRADVLDMRQRMIAAQPAHDADSFNLKQDRGGIVDIEFMVQYCVLRWAAAYPELTGDTENSRILSRLAEAGVLTKTQMQALNTAYHRYLSIEQRLKLMDHRPLVPRAELGESPDAVMRIWQQMFG